MSAAEIIQLLLLLAQAAPEVLQDVVKLKAALAATDQASIDAALTAIKSTALTDVVAAEQAADDAAKG